jgi:hypothetical protein
LAVNGLDVYHWLNYEFGSLNFFWCGFLGRACFKIVFCWGWLFDDRLLDWNWARDSVVIVVLRMLGDNGWLLLVVLSGVGGRRAARAAAAAGAAGLGIIILVAMERVVELVMDLLLQVVESSALISLMLLLGIIHLGAGALLGLCLVIFSLILGSWVNVVLGDMLLSGLYNRVLLSRRVGGWENGERDRNSSVKVQIEGLKSEGGSRLRASFKLLGVFGVFPGKAL